MRKSVDLRLTRRFSRGCLTLVAVAAAWLVTTGSATALPSGGVILNNGVVKLGVNRAGELIVPAYGANDYDAIGLTYIPTGGEALAPGSPDEGWGVGDPISGVSGFAHADFGTNNLTVVSFTSTPTSAVSVVTIGKTFQVTHDFHPSITPNLFEVTVTIKNISKASVDVRYRRVMDWDIPPTPYHEYVTIEGWPTAGLIGSSDGAFSSADPLVPSVPVASATVNVNFNDYGPLDQGAVFDLDFGCLASGKTVQFKLYYGAAGSEADAMDALAEIDAQVYSLGEPSTTNPPNGEPNTFIFALTGVNSGTGAVCIQDDRTGDHIQFNSCTGEYTITQCSSGKTLTGTGRVQKAGCITVLRDVSNGRILSAMSQSAACGARGQFSVVDRSSRMVIHAYDSNITNNSCACPH